MQKFLPKKLSKSIKIFENFFSEKRAVFLTAIFIAIFIFNSLAVAAPAAAQTTPAPQPTSTAGQWQPDSEVSFVGKTASRSGDFLDWTLQNYSWLCVTKVSPNKCDNTNNPLIPFWVIIRNIVYALIALFVLATAFIIIITRGQNITIMRFIPRFIVVILLITFSFSLVQFIYVIADVIQDFFLRVNNIYITTKDLLFIGFDYKNFHGYRLIGPDYDESAFITLLLVRLTAITYYAMTGILLVRKIILWFFIIISPIFPLLIFYKPIRNTAKIWVGEFFRWLLYAPLFAIFLHGLVIVWQRGIPLPFDFSGALAGETVYPTAVNILLGGPGQAIGLTNSVNLRDTFAEYVVALIMLWVVILLPFLLLKIFLDYLNTISFGAGLNLKQIVSKSTGFISGPKGTPPLPPAPPGLAQPAGTARSLPFYASRGAVMPIQVKADVQASVRESADVLRMANLSIPKMRDIARYEASMLSKDSSVRNQATQFHSALKKIANPATAIVSSDRQKFTTIKQKLVEQQQKGNPIATSVLNASQVTAPGVQAVRPEVQALASSLINSFQINTTDVSNRQQEAAKLRESLAKIANPEGLTAPAEKEAAAKIKERLLAEKQKGNDLASSILDASEKLSSGNIEESQKQKLQSELINKLFEEEQKEKKSQVTFAKTEGFVNKVQTLPVVNRVQQVSLDDYEQVRSLWTENYQTIEPPQDLSGQQVNRKEWIKSDVEKITQAIVLLSSIEPGKVDEGMDMVANILPFLLIGGFSKTEVIAYLKAKMEAGKSVLASLKKKEEEEETMIATGRKTAEEKKSEHMAVEEKPQKDLADESNLERSEKNPGKAENGEDRNPK